MKLNEYLLAELEREAARSRRALEEMPDGKYDWKPHEKSMVFGYLADLVATMPSWIAMQVTKSELDLSPPGGSGVVQRETRKTSAALVEALRKAADEARSALASASDEHLQAPWQLKVRGQVVAEGPRCEMIQDTINHWSHHRGQMTVYLRLLGAKVPALYGPSADEKSFA